jgi:hypothetical protein
MWRNDDNGGHQDAVYLEKGRAICTKVNVEFGRVVMHNIAEYKACNNIYNWIIVYEFRCAFC